MKILEVKRHLNKPDESYFCDLLERDEDYIALKYVSDRPGQVGNVRFEIGSVTYAYYRTGAGYVLWKMVGADSKLKGYLFHICRDLKVEADRVEYLDLLLDVWIDPKGRLTILDRDEVEECVAKGVLSENDTAWIQRLEREIVADWRRLIAENMKER